MKRVKKVWNYYRMHGLKLLLLKSCFPYHVKEFDYKKLADKMEQLFLEVCGK